MYTGRAGPDSLKEECEPLAIADGAASSNFIRLTYGDEYDMLEAGCCRANCHVVAAVAANKNATRNLVPAFFRLCRR